MKEGLVVAEEDPEPDVRVEVGKGGRRERVGAASGVAGENCDDPPLKMGVGCLTERGGGRGVAWGWGGLGDDASAMIACHVSAVARVAMGGHPSGT